ncbi:GIY-YIG nuclease family protein [Pseudocnuella soli]|uniref:GIY-YIG nuclease family protein n=1 Tax=Pseudocnuella soli TaxID=2502779 RepID=UPI00104DABCD|nr:GIY-YIG nuclease family protein [Pseudocnuella soli]
MLRNSEPYAVYIMSNMHLTTFYIGVTGNLQQRIWQHKNDEANFTGKYNCCELIFYETYTDVQQAIAREKNLKNWHREWKINLARTINPELMDLAAEWY